MPERRTFERAAFQWAAEMIGYRSDVVIDGQAFFSVAAVALRAEHLDEWPPPVNYYQLTLFLAAGQWRQLLFDTRGELINEVLGGPEHPPTIAQSREVF